ncbi:macro domain-containing protein [Butyrivibrio sp. WCD3002]|uniref:macro domain-containing protein n=1 Tax=Butyrivibrio sp. WCD3002 TaxID=1280676 RepID=UPI00041444ED|nr:macro domain-containing protein [Butyrivibrio sp. WCD3002]
MIKYLKGDIFSSPAQVITNTVNLEGVMGKGIALEFKKRYPKMFDAYKKKCDSGEFKIGNLMLFREVDKQILLFPTKDRWRAKSQLEYIEKGLIKFAQNWDKLGIHSIAFPALGCGNGGLLWDDVRKLMEKYLKKLPIDIYIYIDSYFDSKSNIEELSDIEKMMKGEVGLEGYVLFRHRCITYIKENGFVTVDDGKKWTLSADNELQLDSSIVDENCLIHAWDYIRNVKVISREDAKKKDNSLVYPLMGLMKSLDYTYRVFVSKDGLQFTDEPNAYAFCAA